MNKEESLEICAHIGKIIAEKAPRICYTKEELDEARAAYSDEKLRELEEEGYYYGDFERFYVTFRFCTGMDLWGWADENFLKKLFLNTRKMDARAFLEDPYLKNVKIREQKRGDILLTEAHYERGEFFQYGMPTLSDQIVVPKIGFFTERVPFPAVYEKNIPWVSVCPSEISSMSPDVPDAHGKVLVLGLGLGYYPFRICENEAVKEITVVEKNGDIISLFREQILPQFPRKDIVRVVQADAFDFLEKCKVGEYDFCYADIWESWVDGKKCCEKIFPQEIRLKGTTFRYWIKDEILWYMENA